MNANEYIENRLDPQIEWYEKKSRCNQKWYKFLRIVEIIAAAFIPFLAGYITVNVSSHLKIAIGSLGVLIAVTSGVITLFKFQEHWFGYRTTAESLIHHKNFYLTKTVPYDKENAFSLLVESTEGLISKENSSWGAYAREKTKKQQVSSAA